MGGEGYRFDWRNQKFVLVLSSRFLVDIKWQCHPGNRIWSSGERLGLKMYFWNHQVIDDFKAVRLDEVTWGGIAEAHLIKMYFPSQPAYLSFGLWLLKE